jgi:hypothetical protein
MGDRRDAHRVLVGRPGGRRPLERARRKWKNYIKMDVQEVGLEGMDWIALAQNTNRGRALVNAAMDLRVS